MLVLRRLLLHRPLPLRRLHVHGRYSLMLLLHLRPTSATTLTLGVRTAAAVSTAGDLAGACGPEGRGRSR
jgi:hypothetical protein